MNKRLTAFHRVALSTIASLLVLHSAVSYADDTEIFFGGSAIDDSVRPNVLFVLDNSGSMAWRLDSNSNPSGSQQSRMQVLKESFASIINSAGAINAGILVIFPDRVTRVPSPWAEAVISCWSSHLLGITTWKPNRSLGIISVIVSRSGEPPLWEDV